MQLFGFDYDISILLYIHGLEPGGEQGGNQSETRVKERGKPGKPGKPGEPVEPGKPGEPGEPEKPGESWK